MATITTSLKTAIATAVSTLGWLNRLKKQEVCVQVTPTRHLTITYQAIADLRELKVKTSKETMELARDESFKVRK